jgi:hypothetical protein
MLMKDAKDFKPSHTLPQGKYLASHFEEKKEVKAEAPKPKKATRKKKEVKDA